MSEHTREIGRVPDIDDLPLTVGVDCGLVTIGSPGRPGFRRLTPAQAEEFAQLFVSACWEAGRQSVHMEAVAP